MARSPLLVPIHLDALVLNEITANKGSFAWFEMDYSQLSSFKDPMPAAFTSESGPKTEEGETRHGVYLHWALPDALTRGSAPNGQDITFRSVPNRWLIARFNAEAGRWAGKFWCVESDSSGQEQGSSAFLDPTKQAAPEAVHATKIGRSYEISPEVIPSKGSSFLTAVSPGNVAFAAFAPFSQNVFAFVDEDAFAEENAGAAYTYLVAGWYADPDKDDPLGAAANVAGSLGKDEETGSVERFAALCKELRWSVTEQPPAAEVPDRILCHALVYGVDKGHSEAGQQQIDPTDVQVVVANTAVDALARLIRAEAAQEAAANSEQSASWQKAGKDLERLLQAAQYELLDTLDKPGGQTRLEQQIREHWFGSYPGGTRWELVSTVPQGAGEYPNLPVLKPEQQDALDRRLAQLNTDQRSFNEKRRQLAGLQAELYHLWWKDRLANTREASRPHVEGRFKYDPVLLPNNETAPIEEVRTLLHGEIDPAQKESLAHEVWQLGWQTQQDAQKLPPAYAEPPQLAAWADDYFRSSAAGALAALNLELKAVATARFYHPSDPVVLIKGLLRKRKHGEDGRYNQAGTLTCRLVSQAITGLNSPPINGADMKQQSIDLNPLNSDDYWHDAGPLITEAFWLDPNNAPLMALAGGDAAAIKKDLQHRLSEWRDAQGKKDSATSLPFAGSLPRRAAGAFCRGRLGTGVVAAFPGVAGQLQPHRPGKGGRGGLQSGGLGL